MGLIIEKSYWIFFFMTVVFGGGASFLSGRAIARGWQPISHVFIAMLPMTAAVRFLHFALFEAQLTSLHYFLTDGLVLLGLALLGYQTTKATKMVNQYPWLYEKAGPLGWRSKS